MWELQQREEKEGYSKKEFSRVKPEVVNPAKIAKDLG